MAESKRAPGYERDLAERIWDKNAEKNLVSKKSSFEEGTRPVASNRVSENAPYTVFVLVPFFVPNRIVPLIRIRHPRMVGQ